MHLDIELENQFINIMQEELIHALGCTEPIALALAGAIGRDVLTEDPTRVEIEASGNIIKNVQGVIIPGTKSLKGVESATVLGIFGGDAERGLEVLQSATEQDVERTKEYVTAGNSSVSLLETDAKLHFIIKMSNDKETSLIEIMHTHTNIVRVEKNGVNILFNPCSQDNFNSSLTTRKNLSVEKIHTFANSVSLDKVSDILKEQIECNLKIANEGLSSNYGVNVGSILLQSGGESIKEKLKAFGAAGSDARMSGCDLPVVINSGSGNQGLTITSPIYVYAKDNGFSDEQLYRALIVGNLIPIHIKTKIGRLSAFCGAVTAGIGVGAALSFINGGSVKDVCNTVKNGIASLTGMICDGAKPSCAIKIASSIDSGFMAFQLAKQGRVVESHTGIISECVEKTITNVTDIASQGMNHTDVLILDIMTK